MGAEPAHGSLHVLGPAGRGPAGQPEFTDATAKPCATSCWAYCVSIPESPIAKAPPWISTTTGTALDPSVAGRYRSSVCVADAAAYATPCCVSTAARATPLPVVPAATVGDDADDADDVVLAETVAGGLLDVEPQADSPRRSAYAARGHGGDAARRTRVSGAMTGTTTLVGDQRFGGTRRACPATL
ncbi:MAG: hypothetical protein IPH03_02100 [Tetrasphaera sp.]|nr:hypothetical protein [Tetrasphaera sp.]